MDKERVTRGILLSLVDRILRELEHDPERTIRKLVDLGGQFAKGRFQSYFFDLVQTMLDNEESAYYDLVRRAAFEVDREALKNFGVALGYNSCTVGARRIRALEGERHYDIPWALMLHVGQAAGALTPEDYRRIVDEGMADGVYSYIFYAQDKDLDLRFVLELAERYPDCAFLLAMDPACATPEFVSRLCDLCNLMVALDSQGEDFEEAALRLRKARRFYACHRLYRDERDAADIESGAWAAAAAAAGCAFAFAHADDGCADALCDRVKEYIQTTRKAQTQAVILSDYYTDHLFIDGVISGVSCFIGVRPDGAVTRCDGRREVATPCSVKENTLDRVLADVCPRRK